MALISFTETLNLKGGLLEDLALLSNLEILSLDHNNLTDIESVRPLSHISQLTLGYNQFVGELPKWLGELSSLQVLGLSSNGFTSTLPSELKELTELTTLALDDNDLDGNVQVLEDIPSLEKMYLEDNLFTGTMDNDFLKKLEKIKVLDLSNNNINGHLGRHLLRLSQLEILDLSGNNLTGNLPDFPHTRSLKFLSLHNNFFEGSLPSSISRFSSLQYFDISNNRLSGDLPSHALNTMTSLKSLFLSTNRYFTPGPLPDLRNLTRLRELSMKETARTGAIPTWIAELHELTLLDLNNNRINSTIPSQLGSMSDLNFLLVNRNELTGKVPVELRNLKRLNLLIMDENLLTGDADRLCTLDLPVLIADCAEVRCDCCTTCCSESQPCLDRGWLANYEPIWEKRYSRDIYQSADDVVFVPVN